MLRPSATSAGAVVERAHAERLERDALAVEHPQQVVVPGDELDGRVADRVVSSAKEPASTWPCGLTIGSARVRS